MTRFLVTGKDAVIEVLAEGTGPVVVILPSFGRGAEDYEETASLLSAKGLRVVCPQPRGIGASTPVSNNLTLRDYANDVGRVIEHEGAGPVVVVGHALGNFWARMLATLRPDLVCGLVLAAASPGKVPAGAQGQATSPELMDAIKKCGDMSISEAERLEALRLAFFAPGNDASVWLKGWHPQVMDPELAATHEPAVDVWFAGGTAPILDLRAADDVIISPVARDVIKSELGARVEVRTIARAGHALFPEQPQATSDAIAAFAGRLWKS